MNKIAVFGNKSRGPKFMELKRAAEQLGVELDLISYDSMHFETASGRLSFGRRDINYYDVYFFRSIKDSWEQVNLITNQLDASKIVVDPIIKHGRPSDICKAYQMLTLSQSGVPVPKTIYGSLEYLQNEAIRNFEFPVMIKGSKGDRMSSVYKTSNRTSFNNKIEELKASEANGENRYMLQEYIRNRENFRVMVVGNKVIGIMRRALSEGATRRDIFERAELPDNCKQVAINAAKACGIVIGGVDMVLKHGDTNRPFIFEVNKTPCYDRFVEVTGINVAQEIVTCLANLER